MNKNLVIVRAGDHSVHAGWLAGAERNWDLAISYYGSDEAGLGDDFVFKHLMAGSKFVAIKALLEEFRDLIYAYDRVMLADDDLVMDAATISKFFDISEEYDLELSQPALHEDSFYSHPITLRNPLFRLRFTTFVEIMSPTFTSEFLRRVEGTFGENLSGWGLDFLWPRRTTGKGKVAIVDETPMLHSRPIGGPMHGYFKGQGIDPRVEMDALLKKHEIGTTTPILIGGVDTDAREYWIDAESHGDFILRLLRGYAQLRPRQATDFVSLLEWNLRYLPNVKLSQIL